MQIRSIAYTLFLLFVGIVSSGSAALACSCFPPPRSEIIASSDVVFVGRVQDVRVIGNKRHAWVRALRKIKGNVQPAQVVELVTERDGGLCGYDFRKDNSRITFGAMRQVDGALSVDSCSMYGLSKTASNTAPKDNAPKQGNPNSRGQELADAISGTDWLYLWRGATYKFRFGQSGALELLPSWQGTRWQAIENNSVAFTAPSGDQMFLTFNGTASFTTTDWSGDPASGELIEPVRSEPTQSSQATTASCLVQNKVGFAECAAICPTGQQVLNCTHSVGNLSSGDTCQTLSRVFAGGTDATGQPNPQPHDRCTISAICSNGSQSLSAQGWATCIPL